MEVKDYKQIFKDRLEDLMKDKDLNSTKLAKHTGIPRGSISNWLNKKRTIQIDALCVLADFFGVTTDYLLGREY